MARYRGPVCRLCRREGMKLFLKGERCFKGKTAIERRPYPPGQHGRRRSKIQGYGIQLREKQKVKRMYGLIEKQFRGYYYKAARMKGVTGENLLQLLERRLDNVALRCGFASSHAEARQLVRHRHFLINGKKVNIPSFQVQVGDVIEVRERSRKVQKVVDALANLDRSPLPAWIEIERDQFKAKVTQLPARTDVAADIDEQLIVELYSK